MAGKPTLLTDDAQRSAGMRVRAARAALGWSKRRLAEETSVGIATIDRLERGAAPTSAVMASTIERVLTRALAEEQGVRLAIEPVEAFRIAEENVGSFPARDMDALADAVAARLRDRRDG